mgnify:CR=1 FL=1
MSAGKVGCFLFAVVLVGVAAFAYSSRSATPATSVPDPATASQALPPPTADELRLLFLYGSEKESWIIDSTKRFNAARHDAGGGKHITVEAVPMGSGESIDEILSGRRRAHLVSPASGLFITRGNAQSRTTSNADLVGSTENLVLSPVVIAMWKPMAEALGWPAKPVGWGDVLALAKDARGWGAVGQPQWGTFRFGHTHPEYSNSGLISLLAETYAGAGKTAGLELADLDRPEVGAYVAGIEQAVVHYGSSTGFFGKKMFANGPRYLSAAVLYENMVIESYADAAKLAFPVVAIYPKEGTFWSDHPVGIVEREWVGPAERAAAKRYIAFLLEKPQQEAALSLGFRPGSVEVKTAAPIDAAHGVDPAEPRTTLAVPSAPVIDGVLRLWHQHKKAAEITLVFDVSGSMNEDGRIVGAREGAAKLVAALGDRDVFSLLPFSTTSRWARQDAPVGKERAALEAQVRGLFPEGGTALYDAIDTAYQRAIARPAGSRITALVVLTDGADTDSTLTTEALLGKIRYDPEKRTLRVFTIGYGAGANEKILKSIADATQAKYYAGTTANISRVFQEISTFF